MSRAAVNLAAVLLLAAAAAAAPVDGSLLARSGGGGGESLLTTERVAGFQDVPHTFRTQYKFAASCPDTIVMRNLQVNTVRNIGSVALSDITEDGNVCVGGGTTKMSLVSEATVKVPGLLERLKFPRAAAGLQRNPAALATVDNSKNDSSLLIGFDEGTRTCGKSFYSDASFFFFIREPALFKITITTGVGQRTSISIPANTRSLFITGPGNKLCLLSDVSTMVGSKVVVTRTPPGVSETPAPSKTPTPTPTPSAKPSVRPSVSPSPSSSKAAPATGPIVTVGGAGNASVTETAPPVMESPAAGTGSSNPASGVNGSPTAAPNTTTNATATNGGSVCFPAHATVELASGARVPMASLRIGDRVRTGPASFSDVFLFTHRDAAVRARFVRLVSAAGPAVTLTKSHYLYANGALASAGSVRRGDVLRLADGRDSAVTAIEDISSSGLYNPQTVDGNIVVDGVVASAYTTAVHPRVAHGALLAPLRFLYARAGSSGAALDALAGFIGARASALARAVPSGPAALA